MGINMVYNMVVSCLRKHLYMVFHERFRSESSSLVIERFAAKHVLLKPELIVVNDQLHGFKPHHKRYDGLEEFPIFVEIEYSDDGELKMVEGLDIHAEAVLGSKDRITHIQALADQYQKTVFVEKTRLFVDPPEESLVLYSRLAELFAASYVEDELDDGALTEDKLASMLDEYLDGFSNCLQALDGVLVRRRRTSVSDAFFQASDE